MTETDLDVNPDADPDDGPPDTPRRWPRYAALATVLVLAIAAVAFVLTRPDDDTPAAAPQATTTTAAPTTTASDEEPPGTDPDAVEPYIQRLLERYDEVTAQISSDASVAADPENPAYAELRSVFAPESEMVDGLVDALTTRGGRGQYVRPHDENTLPVDRLVEGDITAVSPDEVTFPVCVLSDYSLFDSGGTPIRTWLEDSELGQGTATRVDGRWLLSRLDAQEELVRCGESQ